MRAEILDEVDDAGRVADFDALRFCRDGFVDDEAVAVDTTHGQTLGISESGHPY